MGIEETKSDRRFQVEQQNDGTHAAYFMGVVIATRPCEQTAWRAAHQYRDNLLGVGRMEMELSNFQMISENSDKSQRINCVAEVDVTTRKFFFLKVTMRMKIARELNGYWFFVDSGEYTPATQAERLERQWRANNFGK